MIEAEWIIHYRNFCNQYSGLLWHFKYNSCSSVCIDVGTNNGIYALMFSKFFKSVHTFDPNPTLVLDEVRHNDKISYHNVGLGNINQKNKVFFTFVDNPSFSGFNKEYIFNIVSSHIFFNEKSNIVETMVEMKTLDSYNFDNVDFIKIDAEGSEFDILLGAVKTIKKCHPTIQIEINSENKQKIKQFLEDLCYKCVSDSVDIVRYENKKLDKMPLDHVFVYNKKF
jgi:FkbM family methyltransferase